MSGARFLGRVRLLLPLPLALAAMLAAGCGSSSSSSSKRAAGTSSTAATSASGPTQPGGGTLGPEKVPIQQGSSLASASTTARGTTVDGIQCAPIEQLSYHVHAHLQVYVNGQPRQLPGAIGLVGPVAQQTPAGPFYGAQQCYYWLHTHTADGVIHLESPTARIYTLGNFFNEWRQPLSANQVAAVKGRVTAFLNGKAWKKDPTAIPLTSHAVIQLDVGSPAVPAQPFSWDASGL